MPNSVSVAVNQFISSRRLAVALGLLVPLSVLGYLYGGLWLQGAEAIVTHDSVIYLQLAKSLHAGAGMVSDHRGAPAPFTHFPPGYPGLLATFGALDAQAALRVNIALALLLWRLWMGVVRLLTRSVWAAVGMAWLFAFSTVQFNLAVHAWSELTAQVGLALVMLGFALVLRHRWAVGLGLVSFGCFWALGTRFSALFLLPTVMGYWFLFRRTGFARRVLEGGLIALLPAIGMGIWLLYTQTLGASATGRQFQWVPITGQVLSEWIQMPDSDVYFLVPAVGVCLYLLMQTLRNRGPKEKDGPAPFLPFAALVFPVILALAYLVFVLLSRSTFDQMIPFDSRIYGFIQPVFWVGGLWAIAILHAKAIAHPPLTRFATSPFLLLCLGLGALANGYRHFPALGQLQAVVLRKEGGMISALQGREREIEVLRSLPSTTLIIAVDGGQMPFRYGANLPVWSLKHPDIAAKLALAPRVVWCTLDPTHLDLNWRPADWALPTNYRLKQELVYTTVWELERIPVPHSP